MKKIKVLKQRADDCWQRRRRYDGLLRDVYDYVLPMRDVSGLQLPQGGGRPEAQSRVDKVFDSTPIKGGFRFAGRLQRDLTPLFQSFFSLEAGPLLPDDDNKKKITEQFQQIGAIVHGVLGSGEFHNGAHEMYLDLFAGTGAMLLEKGKATNPVRARVVPIPEIALEQGPYGDITGIYWRRKWMADELPKLWKNGTFSAALQRLIASPENYKTPVEVWQYTYYDDDKDDWVLVVWSAHCEAEDEPFHTERFRVSPWITPRFLKIPGEPYGLGPAQLAMPNIKTTNKARELQLKAAALALMGIWTRRNDGVFNPATVKFEPLSMWTVGSNGGPLGPTIQRLPIPQDFDISTIVIADEREQMKQALFDDTLPPDAGAVRSATEVAERIRRLSEDLGGVYGRLTLEIVVPVVRRTIDILESLGLLETSLKIDQMLTQVRVIAPIAAAQQAAKVQAATNWMQILSMLGGERAVRMAAKVEKLGPQMGRWLGVDEAYINSEADIKKFLEGEQAKAQAEIQAMLGKGQPPPPPAQQPYVNGGPL